MAEKIEFPEKPSWVKEKNSIVHKHDWVLADFERNISSTSGNSNTTAVNPPRTFWNVEMCWVCPCGEVKIIWKEVNV